VRAPGKRLTVWGEAPLSAVGELHPASALRKPADSANQRFRACVMLDKSVEERYYPESGGSICIKRRQPQKQAAHLLFGRCPAGPPESVRTRQAVRDLRLSGILAVRAALTAMNRYARPTAKLTIHHVDSFVGRRPGKSAADAVDSVG